MPGADHSEAPALGGGALQDSPFEVGPRSPLRISVPDASGLLRNQLFPRELRAAPSVSEPLKEAAPALGASDGVDDKEPSK
jgi:hypothetical protein